MFMFIFITQMKCYNKIVLASAFLLYVSQFSTFALIQQQQSTSFSSQNLIPSLYQEKEKEKKKKAQKVFVLGQNIKSIFHSFSMTFAGYNMKTLLQLSDYKHVTDV